MALPLLRFDGCWLRGVLCALAMGLGLSPVSLVADEAPWIEYGACVLTPGKRADGDAFDQVVGLKSGGKRASALNWRLYGVECPGSDSSAPEEQAEAFGIPAADLAAWGQKAAEFSRNFLAEPFFIYTRMVQARGRDDKPRYLAVVVGANGQPLHSALLEAGLARVAGPPAAWPEGTSGEEFASSLERAEQAARDARAGIWAGR